ncbi:hypothetical protein HY498_05730 [Candidatus Woesearchaeota archaeon]|nr:hypothetical protein [Candidatus Woesearchaeota archaeon]
MEDKLKIKNIKDLEFSRTLSDQNIFLVLIGTLIISVLFADISNLFIKTTKAELVIVLTLFALLFYYLTSRRLNSTLNTIKNL